MRERTPAVARPARVAAASVDVVLFTPRARQLALLLTRATDPRARERWVLPWDTQRDGETLEGAARRLARRAVELEPTWLEQVGAFGDGVRHPGDSEISVAFVGVLPLGTAPAAGSSGASTGATSAWFSTADLPTLPPRQVVMVDRALAALRGRLDHAPIAFRLLPPMFTLGELQLIYEILLGRRLHKASFRRALQAAWLVEPTDEWRSEGRGRPAQLFRYAPRRRRAVRRGVRFEITSG
jgi:8-oxo-dGTP diphosphatase